MMKKLFTKANARKGLTLVETFVAISILMLTIVGPLTLSQRSLSASYYSKDKMIAYYLAQDAVDHLRRLRDTNAMQSLGWDADFGPCLNQSCIVNTLADPGLVACGGACTPLEYDASRNVYGYNAGAWGRSKFTRTVSINDVVRPASLGAGVSPIEKSIEVTVQWRTSGFRSNEITVRENIFDWR